MTNGLVLRFDTEGHPVPPGLIRPSGMTVGHDVASYSTLVGNRLYSGNFTDLAHIFKIAAVNTLA